AVEEAQGRQRDVVDRTHEDLRHRGSIGPPPPGACTAFGVAGSALHSDHEPSYTFTSVKPAVVSASQPCAADTPPPQYNDTGASGCAPLAVAISTSSSAG